MATRLRCSVCGTPICTMCSVRTPVGLRCQGCAAPGRAPPAVPEPRRQRGPIIAGVLAVLGAVAAAAFAVVSITDSPDSQDAGAARVVERAIIGSGQLAHGASWELAARRNVSVCGTLTVTPSTSPASETCDRPPGRRHLGQARTVTVSSGGTPTNVAYGLVSNETLEVLVEPDGGPPVRVVTMGADVDLGGRFFVVALPPTSRVTYVALGRDGRELARQTVTMGRAAGGS